ncbi:MAG: acetyltransferase, partial [Chloroflexi bacterium]|nr:acetyltransferase [Chloroflexota bacterium]
IPGIIVNAVESRQVAAGISVLEGWQPRTALLHTVVIHLGTNGTFTTEQFATIMQLLAKAQRVVFVNDHMDRPWEPGNNAVIASGVAHYPNARLVNWYALSTTVPNVFWADDIA